MSLEEFINQLELTYESTDCPSWLEAMPEEDAKALFAAMLLMAKRGLKASEQEKK